MQITIKGSANKGDGITPREIKYLLQQEEGRADEDKHEVSHNIIQK